MFRKPHSYTFLFLFLGVLIFLTFNRHSKSKYFNYHSVIWSDKAGYYVYLPASFIYNFSAVNFPDSIEKKTGNGFILPYDNDKVFTKYTYGVALLQSPFFLIAHFTAPSFGFQSDGFSPIYHWSVMVASVFYTVLALIFLNLFLIRYFKKHIRFLLLFSLLAATNLYYYSVDEVGMSHIYSFFLFSFFLYYLNESRNKLKSVKVVFVLSIISALIILIRPTNLFFILFCFTLEARQFSEIWQRVRRLFFDFKLSVTIFIGYALVFFPQFLYWYYLSGSPIFYSYSGESFIYWNSPKFLEIWFSTKNGLFTYSPIIMLAIPGLFIMYKEKQNNFLPITILFLIISYLTASWWDWNFGCAFGNRCFVEFYAVLCIPLGFFFRKIFNLKKQWAITFIALLLIFTFLNLNATYHYDGCWYGGPWDFYDYFLFVTKK